MWIWIDVIDLTRAMNGKKYLNRWNSLVFFSLFLCLLERNAGYLFEILLFVWVSSFQLTTMKLPRAYEIKMPLKFLRNVHQWKWQSIGCNFLMCNSAVIGIMFQKVVRIFLLQYSCYSLFKLVIYIKWLVLVSYKIKQTCSLRAPEWARILLENHSATLAVNNGIFSH